MIFTVAVFYIIFCFYFMEIRLDIPDDLVERLTALSRKRGVDLEEFIEEVIRAYIGQEMKIKVLVDRITYALKREILKIREDIRDEYRELMSKHNKRLAELEEDYARLLSENQELKDRIRRLNWEVERSRRRVEELKGELDAYKNLRLLKPEAEISAKHIALIIFGTVLAIHAFNIIIPIAISAVTGFFETLRRIVSLLSFK